MQFLSFLKKTFSFDLRSLALYRFCLGLLVMADVIYRWEDLVNFYTDQGLLPRATFLAEMAMPWSFSLHLANGSTIFQFALFVIHLLFGLMLALGYKTRWATFGAFIMTVSIHNRNWMVNNGGDDVLRAIIFFSIFLPLNRCFSIDSALTKDKNSGQNNEYFSTWGLVFFLQTFVIYFVSYILKDSPIWRSDFTAFYYASRLDIFATPFGVWLRNFDSIGKFVTIFSIFLEWGGPLLLIGAFLFRSFWWHTRVIVVFLFIAFHFGIFLTMNIGLFTFICETMWLAYIPAPVWDKIAHYFKNKNFHKLSIFFDGECGFCQKGVRLLREFLLFQDVQINMAQSNPSVHDDMVKNHSWVIVNEKDERFFHYSAFLELLKHSPVGHLFHFFFASRPVKFAGDKIYYWVSHHRAFMGKFSQFLHYRTVPSEIKTLKWISELAGVFLFVTLFIWNLTTIKKYEFKAPFFVRVTQFLHLYQTWNMFSPFPKMDNTWVEVPAVLSDGTELDLLTGQSDVYSIKDKAFYKSIANEHWRKFYLNLAFKKEYPRYFGGYLCRLWNTRNEGFKKDKKLRKFEINVFSQKIEPGNQYGGVQTTSKWRHFCFKEDVEASQKP